MNENFDMEYDVGSDNSSDIENNVNNNSTTDYGGELTDGAGVDLNDGADDFLGNGVTETAEESIGEDLNDHSNDTDSEALDSALSNFQEDKWSELSLEEQKQSITNLSDYVAGATENKNPPEIVFRGDMNDGEYGGYNPDTNTLEINENMLDDSAEAADTIAHEMWHAYQQQCALDPANEKGRQYQEGFDNYISHEYDFEGYQNQMVEAEARAFAQDFKDKLNGMKGAV